MLLFSKYTSPEPASIIATPSDTDFYKYTMKAAVFKWYSDIDVEYAFLCRTSGVDLTPLIPAIRNQVNLCRYLSHTESDIDLLSSVPYFSASYVRFLENERWHPSDVTIIENSKVNGGVEIRVKGSWLHTIDWEIYILRIISVLWNAWLRSNDNHPDPTTWLDIGLNRLASKCQVLHDSCPGLKFLDMGTRRAASTEWHYRCLDFIVKNYPDLLSGTSNVYFSRLLNIPFFGTHAHEWDSAHLAFTHPLDAKKLAMKRWLEAFDGDAGICLTDTFTTDHFLTVFNKMYANAFTGVRHDSGSWELWVEKVISHYESLGIDPRTKSLVFSDGLNADTMIEIWNSFHRNMKIGFGIGTNLTNDVGIKPLQIVMKMVRCNGHPVLKLSDTPGKVTSEDDLFADYVTRTLGEN